MTALLSKTSRRTHSTRCCGSLHATTPSGCCATFPDSDNWYGKFLSGNREVSSTFGPSHVYLMLLLIYIFNRLKLSNIRSSGFSAFICWEYSGVAKFLANCFVAGYSQLLSTRTYCLQRTYVFAQDCLLGIASYLEHKRKSQNHTLAAFLATGALLML